MEQMKFIIREDGTITIDASGFTGGKCFSDLSKLEKLLSDGGINLTITNQKKKPEAILSSGEKSGGISVR